MVLPLPPPPMRARRVGWRARIIAASVSSSAVRPRSDGGIGGNRATRSTRLALTA